MIGQCASAAPASSRWRNQVSVDAGVQQLLHQVALELFAKHSFHGVSLRQLAMALHMQVGSLYNHIDSKQALLFELIEEHESDLLELLHVELAQQSDSLQQLQTYALLHLQFNCLHHQRHSLSRSEFRRLSAEQQKIIKQLRTAQVTQLEKILYRCKLPQAECQVVALGMQGLLDSMVTCYHDTERPPLEHLAALLSRLVLHGLSSLKVTTLGFHS